MAKFIEITNAYKPDESLLINLEDITRIMPHEKGTVFHTRNGGSWVSKEEYDWVVDKIGIRE